MYVTNSLRDGSSSWYWYAVEEANRSERIGKPVKVSYEFKQAHHGGRYAISGTSGNVHLGRPPNAFRSSGQSRSLLTLRNLASVNITQLDFLLTYAERSFSGVMKTCSPGEVVETKGATEGKACSDTQRMCSSWHCFKTLHSYVRQ